MARKSADKTAGTATTKRRRGGKAEKAPAEPARGEAVVGERPAQTSEVGEASVALTHDQIADRARAIWEQRGRPQGEDDKIWHEAEDQLKREIGRGAPTR
ncbi:MAG: DUF2934 domain-containing protein [Planctomycetes bacterium]|nr:DUF2934 domain-containing protein [Planctomycetota bacterium]